MNAWDKFKAMLNNWGQPVWLDAKPLPEHVKRVRLDQKLIQLHMSEAEKPRKRNGFKYDES